MAKETINNGETGLQVRTKLNNMFGEVYTNAVAMQFSADGSESWHNDFASGTDNYFRISRDMATTWGNAVEIGGGGDSESTQNVYEISLPSATTVAGRIAGAVSGTDYPAGWVLTDSGVDLDVTHNEDRRVMLVTVFEVNSSQEQQLYDTAAHNGIVTANANVLRIQSLATVLKAIKIYILFV